MCTALTRAASQTLKSRANILEMPLELNDLLPRRLLLGLELGGPTLTRRELGNGELGGIESAERRRCLGHGELGGAVSAGAI
jgi:hypothetical protein